MEKEESKNKPEAEAKERSFAGVEQLSFRGILIGGLGAVIITASSMYVALRMSALPWPTIFVAVLSMALLKVLGKTTLNEINITQTAMSSGAMVAGGLAFTLPGLWITGAWESTEMTAENLIKVLAISMAGVLLGTLLTWLLRTRYIEKENLPYPIGTAAAETIIAGDRGGKKSAVLFGTMGLSCLFTYIRDSLGWIPQAIVSKWLYARNIFAGIWVSPMAVGIGYLIGVLYTGVWFLGAVLAYLVIIPLGPALGIFASADEAVSFKNTLGIGLMVGTGIGIIIKFIIDFIRKIQANRNQKSNSPDKNEAFSFLKASNKAKLLFILPVVISFVLSIICGIGVIPSILLILGTFAASTMAATLTGQTGINPMEIFGIIVLLAIRIFVNVGTAEAFFIAACVAIACGYAGDMLNDYKTGHILGTNQKAQLISQTVGGVVGAVVASVALFAILNQFGGVGGDTGLSAAQAFAVSQMVNGIENPAVFWAALAIGALLYLAKVPSMTLGIGIYLSFETSLAIVIGGVLRFILDRIRPKSSETGNVAASGLLGGEGITGVVIAIIKMVTGG